MKIVHPLLIEQQKAAAMQPKLRYDGTTDFAIWQKQGKEKLAELLGMHNMQKCDPLFDKEYETEENGVKEIRFTFQSEEGYFVPCHLVYPADAKEPLPLMVCLQGHSTGMHNSLGRPKYEGDEESIGPNVRDFCVQAVKRGFAAVALEQRCFGECGGTPKPDCYATAMVAICNGRTLIGERVWDVSRLLDTVEEQFPFIDKNRFYCMGNSGGGTATIYSTVLEDRIKAAIPSCAICTYSASILAMYHCSCNYIPQITQWFDMGDLCGLCAPRPLLVVNGSEDNIFPIDGAKQCVALAKDLYKSAGAEQNVQHCIGNGGHRYYAQEAWPMFMTMLQ